MARYVHADVLDYGLNHLKTNAVRMLLLKFYALGDDYPTVTANAVCSVAMTGADYAISGAAGAPRVLATNEKSAIASAGSGSSPDLHVAFTDNVGKVLMVTDEITNAVIEAGKTVIFPSMTYTSNQPTS